jgi:hypothetical protein
MKSSLIEFAGEGPVAGGSLHEATPRLESGDADIDLSLLDDSLAKTPWERMQANDDALRFADSLRTAMELRHAKPH